MTMAVEISGMLHSYGFSSSSRLLQHNSHFAVPPLSSVFFTVKKRNKLKVVSSHSDKLLNEIKPCTSCGCALCNRRQLLGGISAKSLLSFAHPAKADSSSSDPLSDAEKVMNELHPSRPEWYEKLYASLLDKGMKSYEAEVAGYKVQLLSQLKGEAKMVLELGVGTGPNMKYYGANISVVGIDPNKQMEKYAKAAATAAGIPESHFKFIPGVGEALPVLDSSMDAVVCTLVLCSVKDVARTLKEVQRVLTPGGRFIFIEHVAAPSGTLKRFGQNFLDPLQQFVSDGCHLTRETGKIIKESGFSNADVNMTSIKGAFVMSPHVFGTAYK
uniref:TSA: Wollemia nobilis Ref_Wollemi_Transcript_12036_1431 transcribed RNA sequence n=1 Tax=Wollemia nobilis TaxID=56998 RepID=A0A0C9RUW6_9CONI